MTVTSPGAHGAAPNALAGAVDFRSLFEGLPGACLVLAPDAPRFTILAATDAYCRAIGVARDEIVGRSPFEVFADTGPGGSGAPVRHAVADVGASFVEALRTRAPHRPPPQRYDVPGPNGYAEVRHWQPLHTPVLDPDGEVRYLLHALEDVTERVLSGDAAATAERRAARLLEQVSDAHVTLDREFRFTTVNPAAERALGKRRDELLGRTHWEVFPASVGNDAGRAYRRVAADGAEQHLTQHYVGEGYDRHLEIDAYPTDEGGVAVFWRDVTARVRAEAQRARLAAEMAAERERLRAVVLSAPAPMALHVGPAHVYALVNDAYRRISGGGRDVTGLAVRDAFPELAGQGIFEAIDRVYATGEPWIAPEVPIRYDRDGTGLEDTWFNRLCHVDAARAASGVCRFRRRRLCLSARARTAATASRRR